MISSDGPVMKSKGQHFEPIILLLAIRPEEQLCFEWNIQYARPEFGSSGPSSGIRIKLDPDNGQRGLNVIDGIGTGIKGERSVRHSVCNQRTAASFPGLKLLTNPRNDPELVLRGVSSMRWLPSSVSLQSTAGDYARVCKMLQSSRTLHLYIQLRTAN